MELDSFTEKLIERTQARRDYLNKKLSEINQLSDRKRRTSDTDEKNASSDVSAHVKQAEESPKRQCLDISSEVDMDDDDDSVENKENLHSEKDQSNTFVPIHDTGMTRGLAALRKSKPLSDEGGELHRPLKDDIKHGFEESQGFVKSPSRSKLSYDFSPRKKQPNTSAKLPLRENDQDARNDNPSCRDFVELPTKDCSPPKPTADISFELKQCPKQALSQTTVCVSNVSLDSSKDPAELPLSSRRALFEKAFCGAVQKQVENTCESNLSVAQRAALFEKAAKQNNIPPTNKALRKVPVPPLKTNVGCPISPVKTSSLAVELKTVKSPVKPSFVQESKSVPCDGRNDSPSKTVVSPAKIQNLTSPLKNVGPHTLLLQERLNSLPGWQNKDVVVKAKEERKNEISALRSHWEKVSSSSADSNPESLTVNNPDLRNPVSNVASLDEEKSSVFTEDESSSLEEIPEENDTEDNHYSSSRSSSGKEWDEEMPSEKNSGCEDDEDEDDYTESGDITGEAVAVCDEMDELLNEALELPNDAPLQSPVKLQQKFQTIISDANVGSSASYQSNLEKFSSTPKPPSAVPSHSFGDVCGELPLLHTVSFYRKQKQEAKTTPVRSIVRRQQVASPPSPETERTFDIKAEIQALHNEILRQQPMIGQACQALNVCCARAEFAGSSEEVEAERVLLIATQKRQACLNEIQRLKTLHCEMVEEEKGTLTINDIRLPLKRDFIASRLREESDMVHYFLCMIRHRAQVIFTQMVSSNDGVHGGYLVFTNHINLKNLPADFSVAFEVYTLQRKKEVLPHEKKYHIKKEYSKIRLTPKGKKADSKLLAPAVSSPGGPGAVRTPSFTLVGFTRFTLKNCDRKTSTLERVPFTSPLEGTVQFNLQLHAEHNILEKGFLTMFEDVSGFGAWHRRWCVLDGGDLAFWKYPDDEKKKEPLGIIDLTHCVTAEVRLVSRDICARPHTFQLVTVRPQGKNDKNTLISRSINTLTTTKHLLSADTKEERILWCQKLNGALTNVRKWNPHALRPVEMKKNDK